MSHSTQSYPIALDIGGTWIKCARTTADGNFEPLERFANPCREPGLAGIATAGLIPLEGAIGLLVIGTDLGFVVEVDPAQSDGCGTA
ncbi:MAG: ROK family protein [Verrucomicrobiaceae bacterium]|nr:MAG: ROK family protein [Verrucomicrobiaceae bacterium]